MATWRSDIWFEPGTAEVSPEARARIRGVVSDAPQDAEVRVLGYATPHRDHAEARALSQERARVVAGLIAGVRPDLVLDVRGLGGSVVTGNPAGQEPPNGTAGDRVEISGERGGPVTPGLRWAPTTPSAAWSVAVHDLDEDRRLLELAPTRCVRTASMAKVFVLRAVARLLHDEPTLRARHLAKPSRHAVADSGIWQHLDAPDLSLWDVACLVGSCSDDLAANALIELVGLESVGAEAATWVDGGSTLHDHYRDARGPEHPPTVSEGCAEDYVRIMRDVEEAMTPDLAMVRGWLALGVDMSLVAGAIGLDPLSHHHPVGDDCVSKTGCDSHLRADAGVMRVNGRRVAYAAFCDWQPAAEPTTTQTVLADMRSLGEAIVTWCRASVTR